MKLLNMTLKNFGSYRNLEFNFVNQGLTLISGATGSGKSTIQDAPIWILFGVTAKDGSVDEVRNWTRLEEKTEGSITLEIDTGVVIEVYRFRGSIPSQNDLYWIENDRLIRGKDARETQVLLEQRLGVSKDLYITGAYYNEFSPIGSFFTAKARDRRELLENLTDLSYPIKMMEKVSSAKKDGKKVILSLSQEFDQLSGRVEQLKSTKRNVERDVKDWVETEKKRQEEYEKSKEKKIAEYTNQFKSWETNNSKEITKLKLEKDELEEKLRHLPVAICETCGQEHKEVIKTQSAIKMLEKHIVTLSTRNNPYTKLIDEMGKEQFIPIIENPFETQLIKINSELERLDNRYAQLTKQLSSLRKKYNALDNISEMISALRCHLLDTSVKTVEYKTNLYLETYFESEFKVNFEIVESDNLDIRIWKSGYECSYSQLSKGQRGILKLCFSVAIMKIASDNKGIQFDTLFFDEALDGLDASWKEKAFGLFSELEKDHSTVLVIEHSPELKNLFNSAYMVRMEDDESEVLK